MSIGETVCTSTIMVLCEIRDSHSGVAEDSGILGCHTALLGKWFPKFWILWCLHLQNNYS